MKSLCILNKEINKRVFDLESQVIKANDNLHIIINGMRRFINANMLSIIRGPFIDTLNYVEELIDWNLTIDTERHETEKVLTNNGEL